MFFRPLTKFLSATLTFFLAGQALAQEQASDSVTRSDILLPVGSFFLPGLGQWIAGDYTHAAVYSSVAVGGLAYGFNAARDISEEDQKNSSEIDAKGIAERKYQLGLQTYQSMGGFSLYHSFRGAVALRQKEGQYSFLQTTERPIDLALAPFHFSYLKRASTWIPLAVGAAINVWIMNHPGKDYEKDTFRSEDAVFATGFSYNAGTYEEAVFRGWLMPVFREYWMDDTWSNASQAAVFAAAHLSSTSIPLPQLVLGWHLGNVTQNNKWSLGESIFIHTWWDIIAFTAAYHIRKVDPDQRAASLHLPPLQYNF